MDEFPLKLSRLLKSMDFYGLLFVIFVSFLVYITLLFLYLT